MRTPILLLLAACSSSPSRPVDPVTQPEVVRAGDPAPKPEAKRGTPRYDAKTLYETVAMGGGSFSHDGSRILISTDATGVYNVYAQPVAGGPPVQLTKSTKDSNFAVSYFPADDRYLFSADSGGNELTHVWVAEKDGTTKDLTPGDKVKAGFEGWSKDRKAFYVITNERDPKFFDLYRYATDGYARTLVFKNTGGYHVGAISPDGKQIAVIKTNNNADSDIFLTTGTSKPQLITKHKGMAQHRPYDFTPDGKKLIYGTDGAGEFGQAWAYDLKTKKASVEVAAKWDVNAFYYSETGAYRVVMTNEDARTVLAITDKSGAVITPKDLPAGDITRASFDRAEKQMAFYLSSDRTPADLYVLDLASGATKRLSNNLNPKVNPEHLVDGQVVRYKSFDGLEIPSVLYRPRDAAPDAKVPALVWVHGGPGGQSRLGYNPTLQYLVNHGYAVIAVNNRGSSGYGKTFHHMDDRKHGDVDLKDCIEARTYLSSLDWVDGKRVGIIGGSYGGYMTVAALAFTPDAFEVGIDIFGVTNWLRTLESIPAWWSAQRVALYAELGDPVADKERLTAISPLFHAAKIKKPLLVVQGANDPRVLKVESDEIVAAVKKNGVPVEYLVFEDEGHGFQKKKNQIAAAEKYVAFLEAHLK